MKLSFSTVGCPNWTWAEILSCAADLGFLGIELRGMGDDLSLRTIPIFQPGQIANTAKILRQKGLAISCVASNLLLCGAGLEEEDVRHTISLARDLGCPYIRVLGDEWGHPNPNTDEGLVRRWLTEIAPQAESAGVVLL
ncbi:MAG: sugar phosphate isomerase/epimerase, partial [Oscillospiraceae bacterium]|nr:sugar phosphate isomerase/epimerase [Oscillospiraceae bacterium]